MHNPKVSLYSSFILFVIIINRRSFPIPWEHSLLLDSQRFFPYIWQSWEAGNLTYGVSYSLHWSTFIHMLVVSVYSHKVICICFQFDFSYEWLKKWFETPWQKSVLCLFQQVVIWHVIISLWKLINVDELETILKVNQLLLIVYHIWAPLL
jgi:hypothetical protein